MTETSRGAVGESRQDDEYQRVIASLRVAYGPGPAALRDGWAKEEFKAEERRRFLDLLRERGAASLLEVGAGPGHDSLYFQEQARKRHSAHGRRKRRTDLDAPDCVLLRGFTVILSAMPRV